MPDSPFSLGCVVVHEGSGWSTGIVFRPAPRKAFGCLYSSFTYVQLGERGEVEINFTHHKVTLTGRQLEGLVEAVSQQKVVEVRTATRVEIMSDSPEPIVERMVIEET